MPLGRAGSWHRPTANNIHHGWSFDKNSSHIRLASKYQHRHRLYILLLHSSKIIHQQFTMTSEKIIWQNVHGEIYCVLFLWMGPRFLVEIERDRSGGGGGGRGGDSVHKPFTHQSCNTCDKHTLYDYKNPILLSQPSHIYEWQNVTNYMHSKFSFD